MTHELEWGIFRSAGGSPPGVRGRAEGEVTAPYEVSKADVRFTIYDARFTLELVVAIKF